MHITVVQQMPDDAPGLDFGIAPLPASPEGEYGASWVGGWTVAVPRDSLHRCPRAFTEQIVLLLLVPALAVVGLFTFLGQWNDFLGLLIYLIDESKYTPALGLALFQGSIHHAVRRVDGDERAPDLARHRLVLLCPEDVYSRHQDDWIERMM